MAFKAMTTHFEIPGQYAILYSSLRHEADSGRLVPNLVARRIYLPHPRNPQIALNKDM